MLLGVPPVLEGVVGVGGAGAAFDCFRTKAEMSERVQQ